MFGLGQAVIAAPDDPVEIHRDELVASQGIEHDRDAFGPWSRPRDVQVNVRIGVRYAAGFDVMGIAHVRQHDRHLGKQPGDHVKV